MKIDYVTYADLDRFMRTAFGELDSRLSHVLLNHIYGELMSRIYLPLVTALFTNLHEQIVNAVAVEVISFHREWHHLSSTVFVDNALSPTWNLLLIVLTMDDIEDHLGKYSLWLQNTLLGAHMRITFYVDRELHELQKA
jgi:hypothetical protein